MEGKSQEKSFISDYVDHNNYIYCNAIALGYTDE